MTFPGNPLAKRTTVLPAQGFDIAAERLNYSISNLRVRIKLWSLPWFDENLNYDDFAMILHGK